MNTLIANAFPTCKKADFSRPALAHKHKNISRAVCVKKIILRLRPVAADLKKNTQPQWVETGARVKVMWYRSADTLFW